MQHYAVKQIFMLWKISKGMGKQRLVSKHHKITIKTTPLISALEVII